MLLWVFGLLWVLQVKGLVDVPVISSLPGASDASEDEGAEGAESGLDDDGDATEIVIEGQAPAPTTTTTRRPAQAEATPDPELPVEDPGPPRYPVWFESERSIGVCKIRYEGGTKTANLHVDARLPAGKLSFNYSCGKYDGRGSITVKSNRVNGVLFCKDAGGVTVETVRSKNGRCPSR